MKTKDSLAFLSPGENIAFYVSRDNNFERLPIRNRVGFVAENSHELPHLTEPGLVTPLEKILRSQAQGLPVPFNAGKFLDQDYSVIDGLDKFELFELRENITAQADELKREFHAATKRLAEIDSNDDQDTFNPNPNPNPSPKKKVSPKASKEADGEAD